MTEKKVYAVYFSPQKGTKTYVTAIAEAVSPHFEEIDLTVPANREKEYSFGEDSLVIIGAPVYAGRLPQLGEGIFACLKGRNTPAVFNVTYGNREFEDALLEEKELCEKAGFRGIAAGAWIAPHNFSHKIGAGRPNQEDMKKVQAFGQEIREILEKGGWQEKALTVPGNRPYKEVKKMPFVPTGDESCKGCKKCVTICPAGAILSENPKETDSTKCICCQACVYVCPSHSRRVNSPMFQGAVGQLEENLTKWEKQPETFKI